MGGQPVPAVTCESIHDFFAKLQDATAAAKARAAQEEQQQQPAVTSTA